MNEQRHNF